MQRLKPCSEHTAEGGLARLETSLGTRKSSCCSADTVAGLTPPESGWRSVSKGVYLLSGWPVDAMRVFPGCLV